ncbi:MAG TPA: alpha/beta fold hydrolase [Micropepsaceae bacterium]|nr:alpha/beta fold hydrolase [Micropepsaceae bacterium]
MASVSASIESDPLLAEVLARMGRPKRVVRPHQRFEGDYLETPQGRIAYESEGHGLPVLLVHGWEGSPRDFSHLKPALVQAGARVVTFDLPGHGFSDGELLTLDAAGAAIAALDAREGPFAAIIAHSFGCPSTVKALEAGVKTGALVFFAPPASQEEQFRRHAPKFGLSADQIDMLVAHLKTHHPERINNNLAVAAAGRSEPLLIIHADDDEMTPLSGGQAVAAAWKGAKLLVAEGLGHNLALRDAAMVGAAVRFALG